MRPAPAGWYTVRRRMNHGAVSADIAKGLLLLGERIAKGKVPPSKLDETLLLATWNIREFGKGRLEASLHYIAEVIGQFDLVCVVELQNDITDLSKVLGYLGPSWKVVFSDYNRDGGGGRERVGFVYDERACTFTGMAGNVFSERVKKGSEYVSPIEWWRPPYLASFRAGNFDFAILGAHIRWGNKEANREPELTMLAEWVAARQAENFVFDRDLIVVGDFNVPDAKGKLYKALTSNGLKVPKGILDKDLGSDLEKGKRYDQILVAPHFPDTFSQNGGVLDIFDGSFQPLYAGITQKTDDQLTYQMSDHLPLWIEINTDDDQFKLEQIVNPPQARG